MLTTILIGIGSSVITEVVTWLNKIFVNTVLKGQGAFVLSFGVALVGALIKTGLQPIHDWNHFVAYAGQVFTVSQVFFQLIVAKFSLDVKDPSVQ